MNFDARNISLVLYPGDGAEPPYLYLLINGLEGGRFSAETKRLHGKPDRLVMNTWRFPAEAEKKVQAALKRIYGIEVIAKQYKQLPKKR